MYSSNVTFANVHVFINVCVCIRLHHTQNVNVSIVLYTSPAYAVHRYQHTQSIVIFMMDIYIHVLYASIILNIYVFIILYVHSCWSHVCIFITCKWTHHVTILAEHTRLKSAAAGSNESCPPYMSHESRPSQIYHMHHGTDVYNKLVSAAAGSVRHVSHMYHTSHVLPTYVTPKLPHMSHHSAHRYIQRTRVGSSRRSASCSSHICHTSHVSPISVHEKWHRCVHRSRVGSSRLSASCPWHIPKTHESCP